MTTAKEKISKIVNTWLYADPVLFSACNTHEWVEAKGEELKEVETVLLKNHKLLFNAEWINSLDDSTLKALVTFEVYKILLKHPYQRKRPNPVANLIGSNVTVQEYLQTQLEMPQAKVLFKNLLKENLDANQKQFLENFDALMEMEEPELAELGVTKEKLVAMKNQMPTLEEKDLENRHFEFYYDLVDDQLQKIFDESLFDSFHEGDDNGDQEGDATRKHFDPKNAVKQTQYWEEDQIIEDQINNIIEQAQQTQEWGNISGEMQTALIASLKPKLNYKNILKNFKSSIISTETSTSRMRPNRRYGFGFPGKKREYTTKVAFFVDVSGSMSDQDLNKGFSIINQIFKYGISEVDVFQFDTEIKNEKPLKLRKAQKEFKVIGRGGTDFQCIFDKVNKCTEYDGIIIYTDGYANRPKLVKGFDTRKVAWLFVSENEYNESKNNLNNFKNKAFLKDY